MHPLSRVNSSWSPKLAYAVGLITTDGCLSTDGRHIELTSKDVEQLENFMACLEIKVKIGTKQSGYTGKRTARIQFGDINFYHFLMKIGLTPAKTKNLSSLKIPRRYFFDFLRGHHDGDGCFYSYWDPRWKSSFMYYTVFMSASEKHILWLKNTITTLIGIRGHLNKGKSRSKSDIFQLKYAKAESAKLLPRMYYSDKIVCLKRKRLKIQSALQIDTNHARVL